MSLSKPSPSKLKYLEYASAQYRKRRYRHELQQLFWECTLRCNLKCIHCGSDCRQNAEISDMPLENFLPVLDDVASVMNPDRILVITTGGEPLVRKDICECGRSIREKGFHWGMVSNGMLLDSKMCDELVASGLETIAISMDGFAPEHNWIRGSESSFANAEKALRNLADKKIMWDVITCVNQRNINYLEEFKQYLLSIGVRRWRLFSIVPMGRAAKYSELQLDNRQFRQMMNFIVKTRKEKLIRLNYSCEGFLGDYECVVRDHPFFCQAGVNVASVLADGSISGCLSIRSKYDEGNIYREKFSEVWEKKFDAYRNREWMHTGQCVECGMWDFCQGNGMHLRDDDGQLMRCHFMQ